MKISKPALGIALLFLLMLLSCNKDSHYNPIDLLPDEQLLALPTYDGSGQCVHPDILLLPYGPFEYRYLMAYTPYPNGNDDFENPSLLCSRNGVDFTELWNGLNPLAKAPDYDHNDDPDIIYDANTGKFYLYYLETMRPDSQNVICLESKDWKSFTRHTAMHFNVGEGETFMLSPAVVNTGNGYRMYFVSVGDTLRLKSIYSDGTSWNKTAIESVYVNLPEGLRPWHVDVFRSPNGYAMLLACLTQSGELLDQTIYLGNSIDGINWSINNKPLMATDPSFHGCRSMYRSTGVWIDDKLAIWYSMVDTNNNWRIGIKKFDTDTLY